jgi:PAS domain S-box-containing protein
MTRPFDSDQFLQDAGDAIIAAAPDGQIVFWNGAAEHIFGYSASEALGQSLDLIIPERFRQRHWQGYQRVMETGQTRYGTELLRVPAAGKDGRALSIAFTVTLTRSSDRQIDAIVAVVRDETKRWQEEQALRKRIAELEAHPQGDKNS